MSTFRTHELSLEPHAMAVRALDTVPDPFRVPPSKAAIEIAVKPERIVARDRHAHLPLISLDHDRSLRETVQTVHQRGIKLTHAALALLAVTPHRRVGVDWFYVGSDRLHGDLSTASARGLRCDERVSLGDGFELLGALAQRQTLTDGPLLALGGPHIEYAETPSRSGIFRRAAKTAVGKPIKVTVLGTFPDDQGGRIVDIVEAEISGDIGALGLSACCRWPAGHHVLLTYR